MIPLFRWRQPRHKESLTQVMQSVGGGASETLTLDSAPPPFWKAQLRVCSMLCVRNGSSCCPLPFPEPGADITNQSQHSPLSLTVLSESFSTQLQEYTAN